MANQPSAHSPARLLEIALPLSYIFRIVPTHTPFRVYTGDTFQKSALGITVDAERLSAWQGAAASSNLCGSNPPQQIEE